MPGILSWLFESTRPKIPRYFVVEVEKGVPVANSKDDEAIASLKHHPGFVALANRLRLKKAALKSQLEATRHKDIRDVDFLQSGIAWLRYVESEVDTAIGSIRNKGSRPASDDEVKWFEEIRHSIEGVGTTTPEEE